MFLNKYRPIYSAGTEIILGTVFKVYMCTRFYDHNNIIGIVRAIQAAAPKQEWRPASIFITKFSLR